jgi:hypothetical protein
MKTSEFYILLVLLLILIALTWPIPSTSGQVMSAALLVILYVRALNNEKGQS